MKKILLLLTKVRGYFLAKRLKKSKRDSENKAKDKIYPLW
mgnify:CR=1 FL=1